MHYTVSSLCHARDIFKMSRPLQRLFVFGCSNTVCKTMSSIIFYNNILLPVGLMIGCVGLEILKNFPLMTNAIYY